MLDCGRLVKTWGNRGNLLLAPEQDGMREDLPYPVPALLRFPRRERSLQLVDCREWGNRWLLSFEGITDLSSAYLLVGARLLLPDEMVVDTGGDSWVGYTVLDQHERVLGVVTEDHRDAMNPLLTVSSAEGRTYLIPAPEAWRVRMDESARRVVLRLPEGLLEL